MKKLMVKRSQFVELIYFAFQFLPRIIFFFVLVAVLIFIWTSSALASSTLDLKSVSIPDLSRVIFKDLLKSDFVLSNEVLNSDSRVSISLGNLSNKAVFDVTNKVLSGAGFSVSKIGNVYFISKDVALEISSGKLSPQGEKIVDLEKPENEIYTYKAKSRPVSYLAKIARLAGAKIVEGDVIGDVLVYSASKLINEKLQPIFFAVDIQAQAITIKAALIEFSEVSDRSRAIAFNILSDTLSTTYKAGSSLANSVTFSGASVRAALSAIDGDSRFSYLSQPMLRVLDGETAKLSIGSEVPVRGSITQDKAGNTLQAVEYRSAGVILNVSPKITSDLVTLHIDQQISSFGVTTTSNIDSPSLFKRQASTVVDIKKGQLLVLAGLDENKETGSSSGLSFLPKFMRSDSENKTKSQVLLLLEVLNDDVTKIE